MKMLYIALCIGLLAGLVSFGTVSAQIQYVTTDNVGHYTDSWVDIEVSPYTAVSGQWASSKPYSHAFTVQNMRGTGGNLCLAYRFREPLSYGRIYQNVASGETITKSYTCSAPNTYNASNGIFYCWNTVGNGTLALVYSHRFSVYSGNTAFWNETVFSENKIDRTEYIDVKQINGRFYYYATAPLVYDAYETKKWDIEYIPTDNTKKWDMILWGTSGDCDCILSDSCAFVTNYDPSWYNSSWLKCTNLTISENTGVKRVNYPLEVNVSGLTFAATTEIRVTDSPCGLNGSEIPRDILNAGTGWAKILFMTNITKSNNTIYGIYHDNFGVAAPVYSTDLSMINGTYLFLNNSILGMKIEDSYASVRILSYLGTNWVGQGAARNLFFISNYSDPWTLFGYNSKFRNSDCELAFNGYVKKTISCRSLFNSSFFLNFSLYSYSNYLSAYADLQNYNYSFTIDSVKPEASNGVVFGLDSGTYNVGYSWERHEHIEKWVTIYKETSPTKYAFLLFNGTNTRFNNATSSINVNSSYMIDSPLEDSGVFYPAAYGAAIDTSGSRVFFRPTEHIFGVTNTSNASELYLSWYNPLNITFGSAGSSPYIPPIPPVVTANLTYTWDLSQELPIIQKYCDADGVTLVTIRGRYAYPTTGETFAVNQTETEICSNGCSDNSLLTFGQTSACRESDFLIAIITIISVLVVVGIVKVSGR